MDYIPNIAVCDDTVKVHQQIQHLLTRFTQQHPTQNFQFYAFSSKEQLLANQVPLDLLFLDIEIGTDSGIDLVPALRQRFPQIIIMFISNHTKYVIQSHRLNVFQFLSKPFDEVVFFEELERFYSKYEAQRALYSFHYKGEIQKFSVTEIVYLESNGRYINICHCEGGLYKRIGQLAKEETLLKEYGFFRCHHSYLVNPRFIAQIQGRVIKLHYPAIGGEKELPISKDKFHQIKQQYQLWLLQQEG